MEPYVENLLKRARERQKKILNHNDNDTQDSGFLKDNDSLTSLDTVSTTNLVKGSSSVERLTNTKNFSKTCISLDVSDSSEPQQETMNIQKDDFNMEIKVTATDNVRVEVEYHERSFDEEKENLNDFNNQGLSKNTKNKLERLGMLYGGKESTISSPIHRNEVLINNEKQSTTATTKKGFSRSHKGLEGLTALAEDYNDWNSVNNKPTIKQDVAASSTNISVSNTKSLAPTESTNKTKSSDSISCSSTPKLINFDERLLNTLESQGFTRTTSNTRLIYKYNQKSQLSENSPSKKVLPTNKKEELGKNKSFLHRVNYKAGSVALKASVFENNSSNKDPALLSVSERKALFEKEQGSVPLPKAPISLPIPINKTVETAKKTNIKPNVVSPKTSPRFPQCRPLVRGNDAVGSSKSTASIDSGIKEKVAALFKNKSTISQQQIEHNIREQRQKELDVLLSRFNKNKNVDKQEDIHLTSDEEDGDETLNLNVKNNEKSFVPPPPPPPPQQSLNEDSPKVAEVLQDIKRIKGPFSKAGRLYPCLSDIEATTETEPESETEQYSNSSSLEDVSFASESSFGRDVLQTVCKQTNIGKKRVIPKENDDHDLSNILDEMDDYLDEAIAYSSHTENGPTPPKQGRSLSPVVTESSNSFKYHRFPEEMKKEICHTPTYVVEGDNVLPLTHTVSFYRRQQTQDAQTPVRQIMKRTISEEKENVSEENAYNQGAIQNSIRQLIDEINKQQTIMLQTSQALNLCYSTPEFVESTEQVEAEKVLLLATHRKAAAQKEIDRLRVMNTMGPKNRHGDNCALDKGNLLLTKLILPLKRSYVQALNATGGKGHHIVCLIKYADQVVPTKLVTTAATNDRNPNLELSIPGSISLNEVRSDFTIQLEVYCLGAQEEILPHEIKYHINNKKQTPKHKKGKLKSPMIHSSVLSPATSQTIRSPTFALMGYIVFSIQGINRRNWTLNNTPSMSPLEGIVEMSIKYKIETVLEHRGFLTFFEDVSGFGAWHRRWCMLKGNKLSYWKYPEDEKLNIPIDTISLENCITQQVGPVRRDICARLHTMLLEIARSRMSSDQNSLVMDCREDETIIRYLLSADTKEDRIEWCEAFNKALLASNVFAKR